MTEVAIRKEMPELTVEVIKKHINPNVSDTEAYWFLQLCKSQNLNPFTRECYLIKYSKDAKDAATVVVGKDTFLKRASRHPEYDGFEAGVIVFDGKANELRPRDGSFVHADEGLVGGWARVYRKDREHSVYASVSMKEYNRGNKIWQQMGATMIRKVALVQALREAFPEDLGGLYDSAEMDVDADLLPEEPITGFGSEGPADIPRLEAKEIVDFGVNDFITEDEPNWGIFWPAMKTMGWSRENVHKHFGVESLKAVPKDKLNEFIVNCYWEYVKNK